MGLATGKNVKEGEGKREKLFRWGCETDVCAEVVEAWYAQVGMT